MNGAIFTGRQTDEVRALLPTGATSDSVCSKIIHDPTPIQFSRFPIGRWSNRHLHIQTYKRGAAQGVALTGRKSDFAARREVTPSRGSFLHAQNGDIRFSSLRPWRKSDGSTVSITHDFRRRRLRPHQPRSVGGYRPGNYTSRRD